MISRCGAYFLKDGSRFAKPSLMELAKGVNLYQGLFSNIKVPTPLSFSPSYEGGKYQSDGKSRESAYTNKVAFFFLPIAALSSIHDSDCQGEVQKAAMHNIKVALQNSDFEEIRKIVDGFEKGPAKDALIEFLHKESIKTADSYYFDYWKSKLINKVKPFLTEIKDDKKRNECLLELKEKFLSYGSFSEAVETANLLSEGKDEVLEDLFLKAVKEPYLQSEKGVNTLKGIESQSKKAEIVVRALDYTLKNRNYKTFDTLEFILDSGLEEIGEKAKNQCLKKVLEFYEQNASIKEIAQYSLDLSDKKERLESFSKALSLCASRNDFTACTMGIINSKSKSSAGKDLCILALMEAFEKSGFGDPFSLNHFPLAFLLISSEPGEKKDQRLMNILKTSEKKYIDLNNAIFDLRCAYKLSAGAKRDEWVKRSEDRCKIAMLEHVFSPDLRSSLIFYVDRLISSILLEQILNENGDLNNSPTFSKGLFEVIPSIKDAILPNVETLLPVIQSGLPESRKHDLLEKIMLEIGFERGGKILKIVKGMSDGAKKDAYLEDLANMFLKEEDFENTFEAIDLIKTQNIKDKLIEKLEKDFPEKSSVTFFVFKNYLSNKGPSAEIPPETSFKDSYEGLIDYN